MGIYGAMHTDTNGMDYRTQSVPCMANQLQKRYGAKLYTEDLAIWAKDIEPYSVDTIRVNGKDYKASYFGEQDLTGFKDYTSRAFWRLENAYDDFKNNPKQYVLPYSEYPMLIETGQVFVIDLTKIDGSVIREYYISNGHIWDNRPSTQGIIVE
ncbi:hypothetical protein [Clostridium sp.]|uniref:hypothetical protein n=1 Tax=Clostridium sp. TaxID=1506 RepID=UPI003F37F26F